MGAKQRREQERLEAINRRKKEVIDAAKDMFTLKNIETTSMQDIADEAEVGVASVYRYYKNKTDLVYAVALDYIEAAINEFHLELVGTGLEKATQLIDYLLDGYEGKAQLLSFAEQFEMFLLTHRGEHGDVFRKLLDEEIKVLNEVLVEGIQDGSIRQDVDLEQTAISIINLYRMIGQKLAFQVEMVEQDNLQIQNNIKIYKDMMIRYLQAA